MKINLLEQMKQIIQKKMCNLADIEEPSLATEKYPYLYRAWSNFFPILP